MTTPATAFPATPGTAQIPVSVISPNPHQPPGRDTALAKDVDEHLRPLSLTNTDDASPPSKKPPTRPKKAAKKASKKPSKKTGAAALP